jgi:hypothetical protein
MGGNDILFRLHAIFLSGNFRFLLLKVSFVLLTNDEMKTGAEAMIFAIIPINTSKMIVIVNKIKSRCCFPYGDLTLQDPSH